MPIVEQSDINWAKEIDEKDSEVELCEEGGFRKVIEFKVENEKRFKVTNIFKVEKVKVPKTIAERKEWEKFGDSQNDPLGVHSATTVVSDEVLMQFLNNTGLSNSDNMNNAQRVESGPTSVPVKCRLCKGDHWSAKCPHKDILEKADNNTSSSQAYRPPAIRSGASQASTMGKKMDFGRGSSNKDDFTVRVSNLPEEATESDLQDLFKPFGKVVRTFLAKDKTKQVSRGFAFVTFSNYHDAQKAIVGVNDYGYNHLILKVEWAKPSKEN